MSDRGDPSVLGNRQDPRRSGQKHDQMITVDLGTACALYSGRRGRRASFPPVVYVQTGCLQRRRPKGIWSRLSSIDVAPLANFGGGWLGGLLLFWAKPKTGCLWGDVSSPRQLKNVVFSRLPQVVRVRWVCRRVDRSVASLRHRLHICSPLTRPAAASTPEPPLRRMCGSCGAASLAASLALPHRFARGFARAAASLRSRLRSRCRIASLAASLALPHRFARAAASLRSRLRSRCRIASLAASLALPHRVARGFARGFARAAALLRSLLRLRRRLAPLPSRPTSWSGSTLSSVRVFASIAT